MKRIFQLMLGALIVGKIVLGSVCLYNVTVGPLTSTRVAVASDFPQTAGKKAAASVPPSRVDKGPAAGGVEAGESTAVPAKWNERAEITAEEKRLAEKKAELLALQEDLSRKIKTLTRLRDDIRSGIGEKRRLKLQKMKLLIKVYSSMKPQKAATLVEKLDTRLAIELFSQMKGDAVGKILSYVNVEKAARISEGLAGTK